MSFDKVEHVLTAVRSGELVVVVDDVSRDNEGDLIISAQCATPEAIAFMVRYTSGLICVALAPERADALELPRTLEESSEAQATAFTVSVDDKYATSAGISAAGRSATIRALAAVERGPDDFARPGYIFPLRCAQGGVLQRAGHTEAAVDLARLAGHPPAAALCEIVNDDGCMARLPQLRSFAASHGFLIVSIADLIAYRLRTEAWSRPAAAAQGPRVLAAEADPHLPPNRQLN